MSTSSTRNSQKIDFASAKSLIFARLRDPRAVLERLGLLREAKPDGEGFMVRCPAHGEDTPSCKVDFDHISDRVGFYCFGCKRHGSIIDFVGYTTKIDPKVEPVKALEASAALAGVDLAGCVRGKGRPKTASPEALGQVVDLYSRLLPVDAVPADRTSPVWYGLAQEYLRRRGFDPASLAGDALRGPRGSLLIGILPEDLKENVGSKTLKIVSRSDGDWSQTGHVVAFPMFRPGGRLGSLVGRSAGGSDPKSVTATGISPDGCVFANRIGLAFLADRDRASAAWAALRATPEGVGLPEYPRVYIAEGEIDFATVAVHAETKNAIVFGVKSGGWGAEISACVPTASEVFVLTHSDESGCGYRDQIVSSLAGRKIFVRWAGQPTGKKNPDENDSFRSDQPYSPSTGCVPPAPPASAEPGREPDAKQAPADLLYALVSNEDVELIRDSSTGDAYVSISDAGYRETYPLGGEDSRNWLLRRWVKTYPRRTVSRGSVDTVVEMLRAKAQTRARLFRRVGEANGQYFVDLCDGSGEAIEISRHGWRVVSSPPCRFLRAGSAQPLPRPRRVSDGDKLGVWAEFFRLARVPSWQWGQVAGALMAYLLPSGPYPLLVFSGEQGAGKSGAARILRSVVDPSGLDLEVQPKCDDDLVAIGNRDHVLAFDNLSSVPGWLSDRLCVFSTGGNRTTRKLYTNFDAASAGFQRPVILTGIPDLTTRGDLLDRSICVQLDPIQSSERIPESEIRSRWDRIWPSVLGILLDGLAAYAKNGPAALVDPPRMADFYCRAEAGLPAMGLPPTSALGACRVGQTERLLASLDAGPVPRALEAILDPALAGPGEDPRDLPAEPRTWSGSISDLLKQIRDESDPRDLSQIPHSAQQLHTWVRRHAPALRAAGIFVEKGSTIKGVQKWMVRRADPIRPDRGIIYQPFAD